MIRFKDFLSGTNQSEMENSSAYVQLEATSQALYLKFDTKDVLTHASYTGKTDPWLGSLCSIVVGRSLHELLNFSLNNWSHNFQHDQTYWEFKGELEEHIFFYPLELLRAGLSVYQGREYLYKEIDPLICRCFGVRESDVLKYIKKSEDPTPEGLGLETKAGMGCRSCVVQLTKWMNVNKPKSQAHFYKEKSRANWLIEIDYLLSCFPESLDWKMEVKSFQGNQVIIKFDRTVSQLEEEVVSRRLQDFLAAGLDADLSFFLIRN